MSIRDAPSGPHPTGGPHPTPGVDFTKAPRRQQVWWITPRSHTLFRFGWRDTRLSAFVSRWSYQHRCVIDSVDDSMMHQMRRAGPNCPSTRAVACSWLARTAAASRGPNWRGNWWTVGTTSNCAATSTTTRSTAVSAWCAGSSRTAISMPGRGARPSSRNSSPICAMNSWAGCVPKHRSQNRSHCSLDLRCSSRTTVGRSDSRG